MFVKKILIFNPSFLGDSILTTPLIKVVKHFFSEAEIHFCVRPEYVKLFEQLPIIDRVIPFDKRSNFKGIRGILRFSKFLKDFHYDIIISPHKSLRSTLVVKLSRPRLSIGFRNAQLNILYNKSIYRNFGLHEVERNLMLIKELVDTPLNDLKNIVGSPVTNINKDYYEKAKKFLKTAAAGKPLVGISPGSIWKTKMWPGQKFADLINKLYEKDIVTVIFSSINELDIIDNIKKNINVPFIDFSGKLELVELASIIKCMDACITNDTGPMHIAASLNVPVVAIFGPTTKILGFTPYNTRNIIVEINDLYCRPCKLHGGNYCPEKHFICMNSISVNDVLESLLKILNIL